MSPVSLLLNVLWIVCGGIWLAAGWVVAAIIMAIMFALIGNIIWLVLAGWWLALGHLIAAILLAITIIGVPFAWAHLKLAGISLWPLGREIVPIEGAQRLAGR